LGAAGLEAAEQSLPSPQLTAPPRREPEREIEQANQQSTKPRTTPAGMVSPSPNNNTHFYEQQHLLGLTPGHPSGDFDLPSTTLLTTSRPTSMTKSRKNCQNGFGGGATLSTVSMSWQQPLGDDRQGLDGGKPALGKSRSQLGGSIVPGSAMLHKAARTGGSGAMGKLMPLLHSAPDSEPMAAAVDERGACRAGAQGCSALLTPAERCALSVQLQAARLLQYANYIQHARGGAPARAALRNHEALVRCPPSVSVPNACCGSSHVLAHRRGAPDPEGLLPAPHTARF